MLVRVPFSKSTVLKICVQKMCHFRVNGRPIRHLFTQIKICRYHVKALLRRISIQCILSRARRFAIDLQSGHAYFALFGSTIRVVAIAQKSRSSSYFCDRLQALLTDPAEKVRPDVVSIRPGSYHSSRFHPLLHGRSNSFDRVLKAAIFDYFISCVWGAGRCFRTIYRN